MLTNCYGPQFPIVLPYSIIYLKYVPRMIPVIFQASTVVSVTADRRSSAPLARGVAMIQYIVRHIV